MLTGRIPRDENRTAICAGVSSADGVTVQPLEVNPTTNRLLVDLATGSTATQIQGNVASHAADSGNPVKIGAIYRASPQTLNNLDRGDLQIDVNGNLKIVGNVASGATDSGAPLKTGGIYNATPPTFTDGQRGDTQIDASGNTKLTLATLLAGEDLTNNVLGTQHKPVASSTYSPGSFVALLSSSIAISVKATPGNLLSVSATNINAAVRYLQIFNKASAPATNDVPIFCFPIPIGSTTIQMTNIGRDFFGAGGYYFSTGIAIGISTSGTNYQAATATDHITQGTYV